jgi:hypothetical protein
VLWPIAKTSLARTLERGLCRTGQHKPQIDANLLCQAHNFNYLYNLGLLRRLRKHGNIIEVHRTCTAGVGLVTDTNNNLADVSHIRALVCECL